MATTGTTPDISYKYKISVANNEKAINVYRYINSSSTTLYEGRPVPTSYSDDVLIDGAINALQGAYPRKESVPAVAAQTGTTGTPPTTFIIQASIPAKVGDPGVGSMTPLAATGNTGFGPTPNTTPATQDETRLTDLNPFDPRLVFAINPKDGSVVYSTSSANEHPMVDGMVVAEDPTNPQSPKIAGQDLSDDKAAALKDFFGVPAIMNTNSYINLQAAGGKGNNKYLIDRKNEIRWYNATEPVVGVGAGVQPTTAPTTTAIVQWSNAEENVYKFPYRFTDFAFLKWWKKIPNNYLITLRRYPFPVNDGVISGEEARGELDKQKLKPTVTMLTYLGEEPGNKMSTILGPIETGLKWKDLNADVWEVTTSSDGGSVNNPAPGLAKALGFLDKGGAGTKTRTPPPTPPDPYNNGPYANKIIGPVNVIDSTKMRVRGLEFKHSLSISFEYVPRNIGGINTKAAGLDILANIMLMTSATAPFWGGQNRHVPNAGAGTHDPFLGGDAGKAAWMRGDPEGFFNTLKDQFTRIFDNVSGLFDKVMSDPQQGLQEIAKGGMKEFMKMSTTQARGTVSGMHSLLTGAPVGEWHIMIGPPMNPMMMMGNMICTGSKTEFSDELGPDDFPTEIKTVITLEHGMPRDKTGIESMFNKGRGRIYSVPKGYELSFASDSQSPVDSSIASNYKYRRNESDTQPKPNPQTAERNATDPNKTNVYPTVASPYGALYVQGHGYIPGLVKNQTENQNNAKK
jgi:hypothetical protein